MQSELELIKLAQSGDRKAMNDLCKMHIGFVKNVASYFSIPGMDFDDVVQLCYDGLVKGIEDFQIGSDNKLLTYAVHKMRSIASRKIGELKKKKRDGKVCSLDSEIKMPNYNKVKLCDTITTDGDFYNEDCFDLFELSIERASIPEKNKDVLFKISQSIKYEYGSVCGLQAVGDVVGLSRERVRQIVKNVRCNPNFKLLHKQLKEMLEV